VDAENRRLVTRMRAGESPIRDCICPSQWGATALKKKQSVLSGATLDLSGPMEFVASRKEDMMQAELHSKFRPTLHIDLRMTDSAGFLVVFIPTKNYSGSDGLAVG